MARASHNRNWGRLPACAAALALSAVIVPTCQADGAVSEKRNFEMVRRRHPNCIGLQQIERRIEIVQRAEQLCRERLQSCTAAAALGRMEAIALGGMAPAKREANMPLMLSPEGLYRAAKPVFAGPLQFDGLTDSERTAVLEFYESETRRCIESVKEPGTGAVAESARQDYLSYLVLLPALCRPVNHSGWPRADFWPRGLDEEELQFLSDYALLRLGRPQVAMSIAAHAAKRAGRPFVRLDYYRDAAAECVGRREAATAIECLRLAEGLAPEGRKHAFEVRRGTAEVLKQLGQYDDALTVIERLLRDYTDPAHHRELVWSQIKLLVNKNAHESAAAHVGRALKDDDLEQIKPYLVFAKWHILCRQGNLRTAIAVAESFLEEHSNAELAAPVMLWLGRMRFRNLDYDQARRMFRQLLESFPVSEEARRARPMLTALNRMHSSAGGREPVGK